MSADTFHVDMSGVADLHQALRTIRKKSAFHAVRLTLTDAARLAEHSFAGAIRREFTLRNKWTLGGLRSSPAQGRSMADLVSRAGHLNPYMAKQEEGFTEEAKGEHGIQVPTPAAAGQRSARKRTKPVRRPNYGSAMKASLAGRPKKGTDREQVFAGIREAVKNGRKFSYLPIKGAPGIYRITGSKRPKLTRLYSMGKRSIRTEKHVWMVPAAQTVAASIPDLYRRRATKELDEAMRHAGLRRTG